MIYINSPLLGSLILIFISIIFRIYVSILRRKWISYLIILLFLGGIIVLFVYICTLISRLKNYIKNSYNWVIASVFLVFVLRNFIYFSNWDFSLELKSVSLSIIYRNSNFTIIILSIIYLLIVLVTRIKISQKFKGGLKSKINEI